MASPGDLRGIEPHAVVKAHQAGRNQTRPGTDVRKKIFGREEAAPRLDHDHFQPARRLHREPRREVRGKFSPRQQHFVPRLPVESRRHCR